MVRTTGLLVALMALAACVPSPAPPAPVSAPPPRPQSIQRPVPIQRPTPVQTPRPAQTLAPPPLSAGWMDAPLSPGGWTYRGSIALFGPRGAPTFAIGCEPGRRVSLGRTDGVSAASLTFRTSSTSRTIPAAAASGPFPGSEVRVAAADPLLDALAFSRGRFAVEAAGAPTLVIPAWPELARVVEDCRR